VVVGTIVRIVVDVVMLVPAAVVEEGQAEGKVQIFARYLRMRMILESATRLRMMDSAGREGMIGSKGGVEEFCEKSFTGISREVVYGILHDFTGI
jgi:hypothetical protein